jgi:hypothetical protein
MVGTGDEALQYRIHKRLICHYSGYFEAACRSEFRETVSGRFDLTDHDPDAFKQFVEWLYHWDKAVIPLTPDTDTLAEWTPSVCIRSWILSDKLLALEFGKFVLAKFRLSLHLITAEEQNYIFHNTLTNSALRLFSESWTAWGHRQSVYSAAIIESVNSTLVLTSAEWVDPREYQISHWYEPCARLERVFCAHKTLDIPNQAPPVTPRALDRPSEVKRLEDTWGGRVPVAIILAMV